jgi:hypothetical protein
MAESVTVRAEDLMPVRSRVSWGAILAGAMVALALYFLLTLLGAAVGLSVGGRVGPENIGSGAAVWAIASTLLALFVGGYVTSQCTVGENKGEAVLYGLILWGVLFGMLLWLTATGVRSGFHAMVGVASAGEVAARNTTADDWEAAARRAGVPQGTVDEWRRKAADGPDAARRAAEDPQNRQAVAEAATRVTWWAFFGTLLSMVASVAGAYVGAGPTLRLMTLAASRTRAERPEPAGRM